MQCPRAVPEKEKMSGEQKKDLERPIPLNRLFSFTAIQSKCVRAPGNFPPCVLQCLRRELSSYTHNSFEQTLQFYRHSDVSGGSCHPTPTTPLNRLFSFIAIQSKCVRAPGNFPPCVLQCLRRELSSYTHVEREDTRTRSLYCRMTYTHPEAFLVTALSNVSGLPTVRYYLVGSTSSAVATLAVNRNKSLTHVRFSQSLFSRCGHEVPLTESSRTTTDSEKCLEEVQVVRESCGPPPKRREEGQGGTGLDTDTPKATWFIGRWKRYSNWSWILESSWNQIFAGVQQFNLP
ncbi:hypothetical protein J6590_007647 [Homalodisca vitripennis]|nr:hypothetical protein J6590_007647 [Homalodisca vitripennis]